MSVPTSPPLPYMYAQTLCIFEQLIDLQACKTMITAGKKEVFFISNKYREVFHLKATEKVSVTVLRPLGFSPALPTTSLMVLTDCLQMGLLETMMGNCFDRISPHFLI